MSDSLFSLSFQFQDESQLPSERRIKELTRKRSITKDIVSVYRHLYCACLTSQDSGDHVPRAYSNNFGARAWAQMDISFWTKLLFRSLTAKRRNLFKCFQNLHFATLVSLALKICSEIGLGE